MILKTLGMDSPLSAIITVSYKRPASSDHCIPRVLIVDSGISRIGKQIGKRKNARTLCGRIHYPGGERIRLIVQIRILVESVPDVERRVLGKIILIIACALLSHPAQLIRVLIKRKPWTVLNRFRLSRLYAIQYQCRLERILLIADLTQAA